MKKIMLTSAAILAFTAPVFSQSQQVTPNYRVVERGRSIKLQGYGSFAGDCTPLGRATVSVVSAPRGGQVETEAGSDFPNFSTTNVRWKCDRIRGPETIMYYHASREFTGQDTFNIEIVFSNGEARQEHWTVYVR